MTLFSCLRALLLTCALAMVGLAIGNAQDVTIQRAADHRALTVRYTGAAVALLELRLNGSSFATKNVSDRALSGEASFTIEPARLRDGDNQAEVRLYDRAGKLVATSRTILTMDRSGTGPVYLSKPTPGSTLQGEVEISVGFKANIRNPYVSFFVDDQFKSLRNYPPYSFLWDTTQVENGWHEVEAWVIDQSSQTLKTERVRVFVNNPGGRTNRVTEGTEKEPPVRVEGLVATVPSAAPAMEVGVQALAGDVSAASPPPRRVGEATQSMGLRMMRPTGRRTAESGTPGRGLASATAPGRVAIPAAPIIETEARTQPTVAAETPEETGKLAAATVGSEASQSVVSPAPAVRPIKAAAEAPSMVAVIPATPAAEPARPAPKLAFTYGSRLAFSGAYSITLDGRAVRFDIDPRVEDGIALAPFRHLIEHVGAKVRWRHEEKTVLAEGLGRDVWFRIGETFAYDGSETVNLERASFLDRGRAIVPLSFVQGLLGVEVEIDPKSRHAVVTRSRKD